MERTNATRFDLAVTGAGGLTHADTDPDDGLTDLEGRDGRLRRPALTTVR